MTAHTFRDKIEILADVYTTRFPGLYRDYELKGIVTHPSFQFSKDQEQEIFDLINEVFAGADESVIPVSQVVADLRTLAQSK